MIEHTEESMRIKLRSFLSTFRMRLSNMYVFAWESDLLFLTKACLWYEIEIKISRSDFKADSKKVQRHAILEHGHPSKKPNYFYYAVPDGMVKLEEIPAHAGLIYVKPDGGYQIMKQAPKLHSQKNDPNMLKLADKFYYHMVNAKSAMREAKAECKQLNAYYDPARERETQAYKNGVESLKWKAIDAFKGSCASYDQYVHGCKEGRRCGGCEHITKFKELIDNLK